MGSSEHSWFYCYLHCVCLLVPLRHLIVPEILADAHDVDVVGVVLGYTGYTCTSRDNPSL